MIVVVVFRHRMKRLTTIVGLAGARYDSRAPARI